MSDGITEPQKAPEASVDLTASMAAQWKDVYRLLYRLTNNMHDAEDLAQEALVRALEHAESFRPGTNLRSWLFRIATNAFLDLHRKRRVSQTSSLPDNVEHTDPGPSARLEGEEMGKALAAAIARLPHTTRAVFVLRAEEGMSYKEIGDAVGASEVAARWHMMQARLNLMSRLEGKL